MCSIGEDDFGDEGGVHAMQLDPKITATDLPDEICKKCNENKVVVKLNLKDAQCKACFFTFVRHKFRAALGSTRIVDRGAKVLMVFDTSIESCIMFDIIRFALKEDKFKRLTVVPCAVFIDDSWVINEQNESYMDEAMNLLEYFGFETHYVDISNPTDIRRIDDFKNFRTAEENSSMRLEFRKTLNSFNSLTSRQDFIQKLHLNIVSDVANVFECKCAFLPTISSDIAATLLADVSLGRGGSMADDISFCDSRQPNDVKLLRPIRNILNIEIEHYVRLNTAIDWPKVSNNFLAKTSAIQNGSLQNLTKQFVNGLQENFASTVSTVFRTGDKISAANFQKQTTETCLFCHSALDFKDSPTLFAIEYSRCVSASAGQDDINDAELMGHRATHAVLGITDPEDLNLYSKLCHGCRNIFRDFNDDPKSVLPQI